MVVVRYYAKRWKIEQMIQDLKQRSGFGDFHTRSLQLYRTTIIETFHFRSLQPNA
ncbi:MAG: hypothetical protein HY787_23555 [Deltaproteobacteria bacterium]|nr:hypothetical protein [Deltaproteobacteria bacterium]